MFLANNTSRRGGKKKYVRNDFFFFFYGFFIILPKKVHTCIIVIIIIVDRIIECRIAKYSVVKIIRYASFRGRYKLFKKPTASFLRARISENTRVVSL